MCAAPSGGAIWCAGDDAPGSNVISLTSCTVMANNAQYGGALYGSSGARMLVQQVCSLCSNTFRDVLRNAFSIVVESQYVLPKVSLASQKC